jgi:hypothetical protein
LNSLFDLELGDFDLLVFVLLDDLRRVRLLLGRRRLILLLRKRTLRSSRHDHHERRA